jgi:hypothetical protein
MSNKIIINGHELLKLKSMLTNIEYQFFAKSIWNSNGVFR